MIKKFFKDKDNIKTLIIILVLPVIIELIIEIFSRSSIINGFGFMFTHPVPFLCNTLIIMCTISIALLVKKRLFTYVLISIIWVVLGIVNMVLLYCRVTPFNASDFRLIDSAISTAGKYFNGFTFTLMALGIIAVIVVLVVLFIKSPKVQYKINYVANLIVISIICVITACVINISIDTNFLSLRFSNLTDSYLEYGFVYCFGNSLVNTGVKKPSDYSEEKIDEIIKDMGKEDNADEKEKITPNVIFLQLESFFDISKVNYLKLSENPIPTFTKLKKNFTSGYLNVYNVGYGTSNTEFEIITGMNLDDFGPGEFPYKTILQKTTCESICYDLKKNGYSTHAIHDNEGTFYSRNTVFANLGFDTFTSIEYMNNIEFTPMGWAKDKCLTSEIVNTMKSTPSQDYIYTISVQGHGSYPTTQPDEEPRITVSGIEDEGRKNAFEYYVNEINEMDQFVAELIAQLEKYDEDVVLVMYGDHLPGLGFSDDDLTNGSVYQTEYVMWNNFGLKKNDEDVQTFQLASKVMEELGISTGVINNFHQKYKNDEEYLTALQNLEYDILYGDLVSYDGINPYEPTNIHMGINDISIEKVVKENEEGDILIEGQNFTPYSIVYVNGDSYSTEFIDTNKLRISYDSLESLDSFTVCQVTEDGTTLSETKECLYYGNN